MIRDAIRMGLLVAGVSSATACALVLGDFQDLGNGSGGGTTTGHGGHGGGGASSSSSSSSSSGIPTGCTDDPQCDDMNPCTADTCNTATGHCVNDAIPDGPVPGFTDTMKDCETQKCVGGVQKTVPLDTDVPVSTDPCVTAACSDGAPVLMNEPSGTDCGQGAQQCDGMGHCVGCQKDNDCPMTGPCQTRNCDANNACTPDNLAMGASCPSGVCDGMGACVGCLKDGDCAGGLPKICVNHQCISSCGDGVKDGNEAAVDCGGACPGCPVGSPCGVNADCASKVCKSAACAAPSCTDAVKNGTETDTDCGGTCPSKCANGKSCAVNGDCQSAHCIGGLCVAACSDGVKDGNETDVDCGGSCATKCANGKGCSSNADCVSANCTGNVCAVSTCADGQKNGAETDVDCGGGTCPKCGLGDGCLVDTDCLNGTCNTQFMICF